MNHIVLHLDQSLACRLDEIISIARNFSRKQDMIMATLQEIVDDIAMEATEIGSLSVLVKGLQDQVKAIPGVTPVMQGMIDNIFMAVEKNRSAINAAMAPMVVEPPPAVS